MTRAILLLLLTLLAPSSVLLAQPVPIAPCPEAFDIKKTAPLVTPEQFGAAGDGIADDSDELQAALDSLTGGGTLQLGAGKTYLKTKVMTVRNQNVRVWGYGSTLLLWVPPGFVPNNNNYQQALVLTGAGSKVLGVRIVSNIGMRPGGNEDNPAIVLKGDGVAAVDNIIEYAVNGVMARNAANYLIARNTVSRTWADAIHNTAGSHHGRIVCNVVRDAGDDGVAIVNYTNPAGAPPDMKVFEIAWNDIRGNWWGRGIAVLGGAVISIHHNWVQASCHGAAIYLAGDWNYDTASINGVEVLDNTVKDIQRDPAGYDPEGKCTQTGHGAVMIYTPDERWRVDNVRVKYNVIARVLKYGVQAKDVNGCNVTQGSNQITDATYGPLLWEGFTCNPR